MTTASGPPDEPRKAPRQPPPYYGPPPPPHAPPMPVPPAPYRPPYPPPPYRPQPQQYPQGYSPYSGPPSRYAVDQTTAFRPPSGLDWPQTWPGPQTQRGGAAAMGCLIAAAVLSVAYALWAFTARRGIFADFSAGRAVTSSRARTNDRIDTVLIIVAGIATVVALAWWVTHRIRRRSGTPAEVGGFALTAVGVVIVGVGLSLAGTVTDGATRVAEGDRGVTTAIVSGTGFAVLALGLLLGAATVRRAPMPSPHQPVAQGYPPSAGPW